MLHAITVESTIENMVHVTSYLCSHKFTIYVGCFLVNCNISTKKGCTFYIHTFYSKYTILHIVIHGDVQCNTHDSDKEETVLHAVNRFNTHFCAVFYWMTRILPVIIFWLKCFIDMLRGNGNCPNVNNGFTYLFVFKY